MQRRRLCRGIFAIAFFLVSSVVLAQSRPVPILTVDAASNRHPINPDIYGIANYALDPVFAKEIHVPNVRWGGDITTRYDWLVDSSNMGFDWYFVGGCSQASLVGFPSCNQTSPAPGYSVDQMIVTYEAAGARPLVTIPIIPYVDRGLSSSCSFPVSTYGPQQRVDPVDHPDGQQCGNSLAILGNQIIDADIYANHVDNSVSLQQGWIQHLISTFGTAINGGVPYYQLDNEPSLWSYTHRDVMPGGADYPAIVSLAEPYAAMIKASDPSAKVFGPSDFSPNGSVGNPAVQNNLYAGQYYLQQMAAYDQRNGQRILDYFDEHYYATSFDDASELASTRALWDPTYTSSDFSVFNAPIQLIPRFESWIQQFYAGTKLSLSEYGFSSGRNPLVDGITQADVLGIFGREGLDLANLWTIPMPPAPVLCVFRLFRNYDGQGGQFGDNSIESNSRIQGALSVYGAQRSSDHALTVLVINKTTQPITTVLSLANFSAATASAFSYSNADLAHVLPVGDVAVIANQIDYTYPAYSATLFVIPDADPVPSTVTLVSTSASSFVAGQTTTFTATVSEPDSSAVPAGTVSFYNDQTVLATVPLIGDQAFFSTSGISAGAHTITAAYSGAVNYAASASAPLTITVSSPPDYSLALSNSVLQVAPGSSSQLTLTATAHSGFAAPVGFSCAGLPTGVTCAFNPQTLAFQGGSASTTLTVAAPVSTSVAVALFSNLSARGELLLLLPIILVLLFARAAKQFSSPSRFARVIVLAACCLSLAGCAFWTGGNAQSAVADVRSAYIITVTASGHNAPKHTQEFLLNLE
jgi:hypothetical protein